MTHDILQSDIDLARRLLNEHRPKSEIVTALSYRGIDSERATELVTELESGKKVEPDKPIKITLTSNPVRKETGEIEPNAPQKDSRIQRAGYSESRRKGDGLPWFTIIALVSAAVCVGAFVFVSRKSHSVSSIKSNQSQLDKSATGAIAMTAGSNPRAISVEVESDGLRLCGNTVTSETFLANILEILGTPSRTNEVLKAEQTVYVYDTSGLMVYSPKVSGHRSIVLDFEGSDGATGTKNAFVGLLKVGNQLVQNTTGAASLTLIKGLEVQTPRSASGFFRAEYGSVELVFGYLKSPERLSLVEIDFK